MMNLFSTFNPISSTYLSMNWMMLVTPILIFMDSPWALNSSTPLMNNKFNNNTTMQFKSSLKKNSSNLPVILSIAIMITIYNLTSLLPNTFSITSHITINLSMSLIIWMALMVKKSNNMKNLLSNLTPTNTPMTLIPLMVMIELVSMMIQPITLSIRLTANITAGHIMMIMISQLYQTTILPSMIINLMMMLMELGVSLIQAYVFSLLIVMYSK